ncbi:hypothetical protein FOA24_31815 [Bacillus thuringiensis]
MVWACLKIDFNRTCNVKTILMNGERHSRLRGSRKRRFNVNNSGGETYYVTANKAYVYVK